MFDDEDTHDWPTHNARPESFASLRRALNLTRHECSRVDLAILQRNIDDMKHAAEDAVCFWLAARAILQRCAPLATNDNIYVQAAWAALREAQRWLEDMFGRAGAQFAKPSLGPLLEDLRLSLAIANCDAVANLNKATRRSVAR